MTTHRSTITKDSHFDIWEVTCEGYAGMTVLSGPVNGTRLKTFVGRYEDGDTLDAMPGREFAEFILMRDYGLTATQLRAVGLGRYTREWER